MLNGDDDDDDDEYYGRNSPHMRKPSARRLQTFWKYWSWQDPTPHSKKARSHKQTYKQNVVSCKIRRHTNDRSSLTCDWSNNIIMVSDQIRSNGLTISTVEQILRPSYIFMICLFCLTKWHIIRFDWQKNLIGNCLERINFIQRRKWWWEPTKPQGWRGIWGERTYEGGHKRGQTRMERSI